MVVTKHKKACSLTLCDDAVKAAASSMSIGALFLIFLWSTVSTERSNAPAPQGQLSGRISGKARRQQKGASAAVEVTVFLQNMGCWMKDIDHVCNFPSKNFIQKPLCKNLIGTKKRSDEGCILSESASREDAVPFTLGYLDICLDCGKRLYSPSSSSGLAANAEVVQHGIVQPRLSFVCLIASQGWHTGAKKVFKEWVSEGCLWSYLFFHYIILKWYVSELSDINS